MRAPELLREWRTKAGLSQEEAAKRLDVRQPTWSDYEKGRKAPRIALALKIASLTGGLVPVESWGDELPAEMAPAPGAPPSNPGGEAA